LLTGAPTNVTPLPRVRPGRFRFNGDAQARAALIRRKIKLIHGGFGSGKSALHAPHYIDEAARGGTAQHHGLFTNTLAQLTDGILPELEKWLKRAGILVAGKALEYDREPSLQWFRYWERNRIEVPSFQKYRGIATLPCGIHIVCGTLHNQGYKQFQSVDFRTIRIEEVFNLSEAAVRAIVPRCRCGDAARVADYDEDDELPIDDQDEDSEPHCGHLHDVTLIGNPPLGQHWIFQWLDRREEAAKKYYTGTEELDHRNWELLRRGVGKMIMIRVPSRDNLRNVGRDYIEELETGMSRDVALRYLDGEIVREAAGRAFTQYSSARNVSPVRYNPQRAVFAWLDFDLAPRAATFAHILERGEYPDQGPRDEKITHFGIFGELFIEAETSNRDFILEIVRGGRGAGGDCEYDDPRLRGLPQNWDGLRSHRGKIIFSGDAKGKDRSRNAHDLSSDWKQVQDIVREVLRGVSFKIDLPERNPTPSVGIFALDAKFANINGVRAVHLDPITKHLQRDAEVCEWDEKGEDLRHYGRGYGGGTNWMRTHLIKSVIYGVSQLAPMGRDWTADRQRRVRVHHVHHEHATDPETYY